MSRLYSVWEGLRMAWFVYLLETVDGNIYTGIAKDVAARYQAHAEGKGARYTRSHPPKQLLGCAMFPDRSTASKEEYRVKQLSVADKRHYAATLADSLVATEIAE